MAAALTTEVLYGTSFVFTKGVTASIDPFTARMPAATVVVWFVVFQAIDLQYVRLETTPDRLTLRYYSVARFGKREYHAMEFPLATLYDYRLEKSLFGLVHDLVLVVRTRQGLADYDPVSLAALSAEEQRQIEAELKRILRR